MLCFLPISCSFFAVSLHWQWPLFLPFCSAPPIFLFRLHLCTCLRIFSSCLSHPLRYTPLFFRGYFTILYLLLSLFRRFFHLCHTKCGLSQRLSLSTSVFAQSLLTLAAVAPDIIPSTFINFDVDTYDIAFDNCTSYCVTNDKRDFLFNDYIPANPASVPLHGVGGPFTPLGFGTVLWRFRDDDQLLHSVRIPHVAYLPSCPIRLCRPQALSRDVFADLDTNGTFITTYGAHSVLVFNHHKFERTIFHPPRSGIPILTCGPGFTTFRQFFDSPFTAIYGPSLHSMPRPSPTPPSSPFSPLLDPSGTSTDLSPPSSHSLVSTLDHSVHHLPAIVHPVVPLSPAQLELLRLHSRLGHMNFSVVQAMVKSGQIRSAVCDTSTCLLPKCAVCLYGKMRRKPWRTKHPPCSVIDSLMLFPFVLPAGPLRPGSASIDHFSCSEPGLVGHSKGLLTLQSFRGGAVFIDTESMVSYVHLQTSLNAVQTLAGKHAFEREMAKYGRAIVSYLCDNGIFADNVFKAAIVASDQSITYCGVGGHHQNSLAENRIGVLCLNARAMLLHATLLWPEAVTSTLWPFSLCLSNDLCNLQPRPDGPCYLQRLSLSNILPSFTHYHPFGCPVVVLDDRLHSSGDSIPRWEQRCWVGVYLGSSKYHASSVPLVLNLATGHVTTPFHVVFDDDFSLVESLTRQQIPNHWADLYALRHVRLVTPAKLLDPTLGPQATVFDSTQHIAWQPIIDIGSRHFLTKPNPPTTPPENLIPLFAAPPKGAPLAHSEGASPVLSEGAPPDLSKGTAPADLSQVDPPAPPMQALRKVPVVPPLLAPSTSRYGRLRQPSLRQQDHISSLRPFGLAAFLSYPIHCASLAFTSVERIYDNLDHTINFLHPLSFLVSTPNSESLTFNQALAEPDAIDFLHAATVEIRDHESRGHWLEVPCTSMPKHHTPIPAVWSMKRKIRPDGSLVKHKARLCAGGHRQVFELNYWDTYSPVVQWATVRLLLIIAALENLHTRQVDFVLAFPQADLDVVIYMNLPQGFDEGPIPSVLLLKKNLYGLKQASMTWFDKRRSGLKDRGCHQSSVDCCCFIKSDFIFLVFVDDCLLFSRSADSVSSLILSLQSDFILTDEGNVSDYLGIHISKHPNGTIHLTQPALIQRILDLLGIRAGSKTHLTPVIHKGLLHSDIEGPLR